ncbi:hypothetical protein GDO81_026236 [Engystomops pustulosus]|uniref:Secreted protein n=1 Tax=Engystomops pustulosus TaxID=76066 RepID=A0AAV6YNG7_ENGPU|nr:hypothetical protein GDO81_026236 [Engystomops pustulosus]
MLPRCVFRMLLPSLALIFQQSFIPYRHDAEECVIPLPLLHSLSCVLSFQMLDVRSVCPGLCFPQLRTNLHSWVDISFTLYVLMLRIV